MKTCPWKRKSRGHLLINYIDINHKPKREREKERKKERKRDINGRYT